ncbi:MAG: TetR/AcrR family transcriptional regulator C-terminal domain-containing protein [Erysipelotrichia bacterium]|nr:TetR/AcrR family transcriptional regulator C-terminal domain-containing protein [Erysipelotrichia bacterium]
MNQLTKKALANALIKELQNKTIDKITIKDLTDICGINRQTFYYHFTDIYDLMEWTLKQHIRNYLEHDEVKNDNSFSKIKSLLNFLTQERRMLLNAYDNRNYIYYHQFLTSYLSPLIRKRIMEEPLAAQVKSDKIDFIVKTYTYALVGIAINWLNRGAPNDIELYINDINILIGENFINDVLKRFITNSKD